MTEPLDLDAIEQRANAATPGPWAPAAWNRKSVLPALWADDALPLDARGPFAVIYASEERDSEFIAHARTDVPALVAEIRRLQRWKGEATEVLKQWDDLWGDVGEPGLLGAPKSAGVAQLLTDQAAEVARLREVLPPPDLLADIGRCAHQAISGFGDRPDWNVRVLRWVEEARAALDGIGGKP